MKNGHLEAFWDVENGGKRMLSEMHASTYGIIFPMLRNGEMLGQYTLDLMGRGSDIQLEIPEKAVERQERIAKRLAECQRQLHAYIHVPNSPVEIRRS